MRQSQKGNRPRSKSGRKPNGPSVNRVFESSGPEGKVRGTPQQIIEKYQSLARDKSTSGDRVLAESFLQHAEHYMRILTSAQAAQAQHRRDDREVDEAESETEDATPRADAGADAMAVMHGDEGGADIVATPESLSPPQRQSRRRDEEGDGGDGQRRRTRRTPRKNRDQARDEVDESVDGAETAAANDSPEFELTPSEEPAETAKRTPRRSTRARTRPSGLDVIESGDGAEEGDSEWPTPSAVGHA